MTPETLSPRASHTPACDQHPGRALVPLGRVTAHDVSMYACPDCQDEGRSGLFMLIRAAERPKKKRQTP